MDDDTLARVFWNRVEKSADAPAHQFKTGGSWQILSWRRVGEIVREAALGLLVVGRQKGDAVALLSASRPEWVQADFAIFSAGCTTIPVYPSYTSEHLAYIVNDSGARTLIVEDPAQLAKALEARAEMDHLEQIVVIQGYEGQDPSVLTWEGLRRLGRDQTKRLESVLADRIASTCPEDVATIVYTSGTTGPPKGVVQTHGNHLATLRAAGQAATIGPGDLHLLFLPLAHSFARMVEYFGLAAGTITAFARSIDTLSEDLASARPNLVPAVPRIYEKVYGRVQAARAFRASSRRCMRRSWPAWRPDRP